MKEILIAAFILLLIIVPLCMLIDYGDKKAFNNGECKICGGNIEIVAPYMGNRYYCPECKTFN